MSRFVVAAAALVIALVGVELGFRVLGLGPESHRSRVDQVLLPAGAKPDRAPFGYVPNSVVRSTYDSDPRGYFNPGATVDHVHNSRGWRDREHRLEKPTGTVRILGLGDSYMWGQGVHREDTVLRRLGALLDSELPGQRVETVNSAVFGTGTLHQLESLRGLGLRYEPDLVLLIYVPNDVELPAPDSDRPRVEFFERYTRIYLDPDRIVSWSRFLGWAQQVVLRHTRARAYIRASVASFAPDSEGWRRSREALAEIAAACREHGIGFLVAVFPFLHELDGRYPFRPIHDVVLDFCRDAGIECLDLAAAFPGYRGRELWVHPTDQHPNEIAHALAAKALVAPALDTLRRRGEGTRGDQPVGRGELGLDHPPRPLGSF